MRVNHLVISNPTSSLIFFHFFYLQTTLSMFAFAGYCKFDLSSFFPSWPSLVHVLLPPSCCSICVWCRIRFYVSYREIFNVKSHLGFVPLCVSPLLSHVCTGSACSSSELDTTTRLNFLSFCGWMDIDRLGFSRRLTDRHPSILPFSFFLIADGDTCLCFLGRTILWSSDTISPV